MKGVQTSLFYRGEYREALARSVDSAQPGWPQGETPAVIGALAFTGRLAEAEALYSGSDLRPAQSIEAAFYLGVGLTRQSRYEAARRYLGANLRALGRRAGARERFYAWQGLSFYRFFSGRLHAAERASERALEAAFEAGFLYGKVLASDIRGHIQVQLGEVPTGLATLAQARKLALLLGDGNLPEAVETSILVYRAQHGMERSTRALETKLKRLGAQDNYTRATLQLEIARQQLVRGKARDAAQTLDHAAQTIYSTQHRRQEATLNLRYAYLYSLMGEPAQALRFIRSGKRGLDPAVDHLLELALLGLEVKLTGELGLAEAQRTASLRLDAQSRLYGGMTHRRMLERARGAGSTARRNLDPMGDLMDSAHADPRAAIEALIESGYWAFLYPALGIEASERLLWLDLLSGSLTAFDRGQVTHVTGLTPLTRKVLIELARGNGSKKGLIQSVWGYRYHPLRHDAVVYASILALRKLLAGNGAWIETTEEGYRLAPGVSLKREAPRESAAVARAEIGTEPGLNYRQLRILRHLDKHEVVDLKACKKLFDVSGITASRDLSALTAAGLVLRIGRGRATHYAKPGRI